MTGKEEIRVLEGEIDIGKIKAFISRDRDKKGFKELVESIKKYGLLIPVTLIEEDGKFTLIKGEGRVEAHKMLNLHKIKAFIFQKKDWNKQKMIMDWLVENKVREKLSPLDKARLLKIAKDSGKSLIEEAKKLKMGLATAKQYVDTIEQADESVLEAMGNNKLNFTKAKEVVAGLKDKKSQGTVTEIIISDNLSVEDTRVVIRQAQILGKQRKRSATLEELRSSLLNISKDKRDFSQLLNKTQSRIDVLTNSISALKEDAKFLVLLKEAQIANYKEE